MKSRMQEQYERSAEIAAWRSKRTSAVQHCDVGDRRRPVVVLHESARRPVFMPSIVVDENGVADLDFSIMRSTRHDPSKAIVPYSLMCDARSHTNTILATAFRAAQDTELLKRRSVRSHGSSSVRVFNMKPHLRYRVEAIVEHEVADGDDTYLFRDSRIETGFTRNMVLRRKVRIRGPRKQIAARMFVAKNARDTREVAIEVQTDEGTVLDWKKDDSPIEVDQSHRTSRWKGWSQYGKRDAALRRFDAILEQSRKTGTTPAVEPNGRPEETESRPRSKPLSQSDLQRKIKVLLGL